tara:strand:+ start:5030 stop:5272 length:243 start_codon:yes stop_codon:yes gene_type:complete
MFEMVLATEVLGPEEVIQITGCARRNDQINWLELQGWAYVKTRAGEPIIGRLYARLKLAGISTQLLMAVEAKGPDLSKIR